MHMYLRLAESLIPASMCVDERVNAGARSVCVCVCGLSVCPPMAGPSAPCLPVTSGSPRRGQ